MNISKFKGDDWVQIWEGGWSFLSCSHFGDQYTKEIRFGRSSFVPRCVLFSHNGRSTAWIHQNDRDRLGKFLSEQVKHNSALGKKISQHLKKEVDLILPFMRKYLKGEITIDVYKDFWHRILVYYHPHINVKYTVDYLDENQLKSLLPYFEDARVYAEPVFQLSEKFVYRFAKQHSRSMKLPYTLVLSLTKRELYDYFNGVSLPKRDILEKRYKNSALLFDQKNSEVVIAAQVKEIERLLIGNNDAVELKGVTGYPGKIKAVARVINDPALGKRLKRGEILISGMTRPDFLPIMERAAAFVTDAGGILCHAAIVAREMKKPCVIGTKVATRVFKDGDVVEIDAAKGLVRKVK